MLNVVTQRRLTDALMTYQQDCKDCKDLQRLSLDLMLYVWRYLEVNVECWMVFGRPMFNVLD